MLNDQASQTTILMRWHASTSIFYIYIKDCRLEVFYKTLQHFISTKTLSKSLRIKYLEFFINFHILEILSLESKLCCIF